jgi:hypothetical protein
MLAANPSLCETLRAGAAQLSGAARRQFMATVTNALGPGGQRWAEAILGWNRVTVRKGQRELAGQQPAVDHFHRRGRKPAHHHLPALHADIRTIVNPNLEPDPTFRTPQLYRRVTAPMVRESLLELDPYTDERLPSVRTICGRLNRLDFRARKVAKSKPVKKIPQTDAIFDHLHGINAQADQDPRVLRLSMDTKAAIKVGPFSRGGYNRRGEQASDHDFAPLCVLQLFGIFVPQHDANFFFFNETKATADWFVDSLEWLWPQLKQDYHPIDKLVINLDNGPENHSRRTQFLMRMVEFVHGAHVPVSLAYYPPYHSKYNPIERVWGVLENHWRGELLDSRDKVFGLAQSMKWNGQHPQIVHMPEVYLTGQTLSKSEMARYESLVQRHEDLGRWFVDIHP